MESPRRKMKKRGISAKDTSKGTKVIFIKCTDDLFNCLAAVGKEFGENFNKLKEDRKEVEEHFFAMLEKAQSMSKEKMLEEQSLASRRISHDLLYHVALTAVITKFDHGSVEGEEGAA